MPGKYLLIAQRAQMVGLIEDGLSPSAIAAKVGCSAQSVRNLKKRYVTEPSGSIPAPKPIPGRPKKTS